MARYIRKEFLSPCAHETGNIVCQIETPRVKDFSSYSEGIYVYASIKLSDCMKSITLDFDASSQGAFEKRLSKLDKMIAELTAMRNQYEVLWENGRKDFEFYKKNKGDE